MVDRLRLLFGLAESDETGSVGAEEKNHEKKGGKKGEKKVTAPKKPGADLIGVTTLGPASAWRRGQKVPQLRSRGRLLKRVSQSPKSVHKDSGAMGFGERPNRQDPIASAKPLERTERRPRLFFSF